MSEGGVGVNEDRAIGEQEEDDEEEEEEDDQVEYFNPEMAEVYRIISCDTPTCSHSLAKSVSEILPKIDTKIDPQNPGNDPNSVLKNENGDENEEEMDFDAPVDAEDHVQYLVKWRGLSYAECTWERWIDLKVRPV